AHPAEARREPPRGCRDGPVDRREACSLVPEARGRWNRRVPPGQRVACPPGRKLTPSCTSSCRCLCPRGTSLQQVLEGDLTRGQHPNRMTATRRATPRAEAAR